MARKREDGGRSSPGRPPRGPGVPTLPADDAVLAADSGVDHAVGPRPDRPHSGGGLRLGDRGRAAGVVDGGGTVAARHPAAKDATDLELALETACSFDPERIVVLGGHGGRLDHLLANALLLAGPALAGIDVLAQMGPATRHGRARRRHPRRPTR